MLVKLLQPDDGHEAGEVVDMTPMEALKLITAGKAEICDEVKSVERSPENKMLATRSMKRQRL